MVEYYKVLLGYIFAPAKGTSRAQTFLLRRAGNERGKARGASRGPTYPGCFIISLFKRRSEEFRQT